MPQQPGVDQVRPGDVCQGRVARRPCRVAPRAGPGAGAPRPRLGPCRAVVVPLQAGAVPIGRAAVTAGAGDPGEGSRAVAPRCGRTSETFSWWSSEWSEWEHRSRRGSSRIALPISRPRARRKEMVQSKVTPAIVAGVCDPGLPPAAGLREAGYNAAPIEVCAENSVGIKALDLDSVPPVPGPRIVPRRTVRANDNSGLTAVSALSGTAQRVKPEFQFKAAASASSRASGARLAVGLFLLIEDKTSAC